MTSHFQELSKQTSYEIYLIDSQLHRNEDEHYICNTSILFKYTVKTIKKCCYCRGCPHTNGLIPGVSIMLFTTTPQLSLLFILSRNMLLHCTTMLHYFLQIFVFHTCSQIGSSCNWRGTETSSCWKGLCRWSIYGKCAASIYGPSSR